MSASRNDLIYDLIFSKVTFFEIDIADYIKDIYQYEDFIDGIKKILKKSKVKVLSSKVIVDSKTVIWELKVIK